MSRMVRIVALIASMIPFINVDAVSAADLVPLDGGPTRTLAEVADGRPLVVHLWATWCAPCRDELPALGRYVAEGGAVTIVSVDTRPPESVSAWMEELGVDIRGWQDAARTLPTRFRIRAYPTTLLLDGEGGEAARITGPVDWDDAAVRGRMERHLEGDADER